VSNVAAELECTAIETADWMIICAMFCAIAARSIGLRLNLLLGSLGRHGQCGKDTNDLHGGDRGSIGLANYSAI
jgi:hypothetical protein